MCLEESFCPFTWDARNFQQPKIYASPSSVHASPLPQPSCVSRQTNYKASLYNSAQFPLMLTGKAESAQITCRLERSM